MSKSFFTQHPPRSFSTARQNYSTQISATPVALWVIGRSGNGLLQLSMKYLCGRLFGGSGIRRIAARRVHHRAQRCNDPPQGDGSRSGEHHQRNPQRHRRAEAVAGIAGVRNNPTPVTTLGHAQQTEGCAQRRWVDRPDVAAENAPSHAQATGMTYQVWRTHRFRYQRTSTWAARAHEGVERC